MAGKRYKFQAFLTKDPGVPGVVVPPGAARRMTIRARHHRTRRCQFFSALVANNGDGADWLDERHEIVTVAVRDDDACDYLDVGDHFALWLGADIADCIVTRRLYV